MKDQLNAAGCRHLTVRIGSSSVRYRRLGEGDPLILIHGLAGSSAWWSHNAAAFSRAHAVYLIDLPGFGSMRRLRREFSVGGAATWMRCFLDAAGLARVSIVGHSMGGLIAAMFAARWPDAVSRLVLAAPAIGLAGSSIRSQLLSVARSSFCVRPRFIPQLAWDAARAGLPTLLRSARELLTIDMQNELAQITVPSLLIWGQQDRLVPPAIGEILQRTIPDCRLCIIPGAAHVVMRDRADEFNHLVLQFLSEPRV